MKRYVLVLLLPAFGIVGAGVGTPALSAAATAPLSPAAATWQQAFPAQAPPPRWITDIVYDTQDHRSLMFSGDPSETTEGDTWAWDGSVWAELTPTVSPPARKQHTMAYDKARDETVLFGGSDVHDEWLGDTWVFDGGTWEKQRPPTSPPRTVGAEMAYDAARDEVVMFGGVTGNDRTWVWDGTTWEEKHPATSPAARSGHGMAYDRSRRAVIVFGGWNGSAYFGDTWSWNGDTWTELDLNGSPPPLESPAMASFGKRPVLFGGKDAGGFLLDGTWKLRDKRWRQVAADPAPQERYGASLGYDSGRKEAVLFGGLGVVGPELDYLGDTWLLQR